LNLGDIHWVDLPDRGGREQRGRRPAIVWQDTAVFPSLPTVLIIPMTSQTDTLRFGGTLLIQPSGNNGLSVASVALVFQLGACDVRRIHQAMGQLDPTDLARVRELACRLQKLP
jgi:mRNA interferase MazF